MDHFVREEGLKTEPIQISANNEIKGIADSFNKMQEDISRYIGEVNALTTERVQHQTQMEIASREVAPVHASEIIYKTIMETYR